MAEQGRAGIVGFAVFSVVDHGYVMFSGFTETAVAKEEPHWRWSPPESPFYDLKTVTEDDFPLADDTVRDRWFDEMEQAGVEYEDEDEYWYAFMQDAIGVMEGLRADGRFGDDPALVLQVIDPESAEGSQVHDDMLRRLNPGPALEQYRRVLQA